MQEAPATSKREVESSFDFINSAVGYRFRSGKSHQHALVRATGLKRGENPVVVDATAGLGRDAFILASIGAHVTLLERSPEVYELLRRSMTNANTFGPEFAAVFARMTLVFGDARHLLPSLNADVLLVDPMHPARKKTALVKKEMRLLKDLVGADADAVELMQAALATKCKRVVLKWPLRAPSLDGLRRPSHTIFCKTVRYDVFVAPTVEREERR